jgi:leucyl aminopeptidase
MREADNTWLMGHLSRHLTAAAYRYSETLSDTQPPLSLGRVVINVGNKGVSKLQKALQRGSHTGAGVNLARNLANLPANICTPSHLAKEARKLARKHDKLSTQVLEEKKMRELGMGALLSVTAGTDQPAKMLVMNYRGTIKWTR